MSFLGYNTTFDDSCFCGAWAMNSGFIISHDVLADSLKGIV